MTKLAFKKPTEAKRSRPKILVSGDAGVGKSFFSLAFPNVAYADIEDGVTGPQYLERLNAHGGMYLGRSEGSQDPKVLLDQVKALASESHPYKTLVFDSISKIYNNIIAGEAERLGPEKMAFGNEKRPAISWIRQMINWTSKLDMSVVFVAHSKPTWVNDKQGPATFDCFEKLAYELDLWIEVVKRGPNRLAIIRKSRLVQFPEGTNFPLDFAEFKKRWDAEYGAGVIEQPSKPIALATSDQITEAMGLVAQLKLTDEEVQKALEKRGVTQWSDLEAVAIAEMITNLKKRSTSTTV